MTTYNERVRSIAEEFAPLSYAHFYKASPDVQEHWILSMYPLAEIAVRREGEAYTEGWDGACDYISIPRTPNHDQLKHDLGLIKPTGDES